MENKIIYEFRILNQKVDVRKIEAVERKETYKIDCGRFDRVLNKRDFNIITDSFRFPMYSEIKDIDLYLEKAEQFCDLLIDRNEKEILKQHEQIKINQEKKEEIKKLKEDITYD